MKNFVQPGQNLDVTVSADTKGGEVVIVGKISGIAFNDVLSGQKVAIATVGVYELPKKTGAGKSFAVGAEVFYEASTKKCDVAAAAGLTKIGVATEAATEAGDTVKVRLNGTF